LQFIVSVNKPHLSTTCHFSLVLAYAFVNKSNNNTYAKIACFHGATLFYFKLSAVYYGLKKMSNAFSVYELMFPADVYIYDVHDMEMVLHNTENFQILSVWFNRTDTIIYFIIEWFEFFICWNTIFLVVSRATCDFGKSC
jgi:hypothetical protein